MYKEKARNTLIFYDYAKSQFSLWCWIPNWNSCILHTDMMRPNGQTKFRINQHCYLLNLAKALSNCYCQWHQSTYLWPSKKLENISIQYTIPSYYKNALCGAVAIQLADNPSPWKIYLEYAARNIFKLKVMKMFAPKL